MTSREDTYANDYEWLTQRFGERTAEALIPCAGHAWPLTGDEQKAAHAHYERWAEQQAAGEDIDAAEYAMEDR